MTSDGTAAISTTTRNHSLFLSYDEMLYDYGAYIIPKAETAIEVTPTVELKKVNATYVAGTAITEAIEVGTTVTVTKQ